METLGADPVRTAFDRARTLDGEHRTAFVRTLEETDPDVAREVVQLLDALDSCPEFLEAPASLDGFTPEELDGPDRTGADRTQRELEGLRESLVGRTLGGFRVLRHLASGGMGEVFEAEQERPRRTVAIKVLAQRRPTLRARERFAAEADTLARLDHPHCARIHGAGTEPGRDGAFAWIAMERIPDPLPIDAYADEAGLDLRTRVELLLPVCDALHHAHRKGVLHRDCKPQNLLVPRSGEGGPRVIDFGLARWLEPIEADQQLRTRAGELLGTLRYMSPEQCLGDPEALDVRSDVYGLGLVLYELVTGSAPYPLEGRSLLAILDTIRTHPPRDPRALASGCDDDLAAILTCALAKHPSDRYDSAAELALDLERWLERRPVRARRATLAHSVRLFARRRTGTFLGLALGSLAGTAALVAILVLFVSNRNKLQEIARIDGEREREAARVEEARADLSQLQGVLDLLVQGDDGGRAVDSLVAQAERQRDAAEDDAGRREAVADATQRLRTLRSALADDPESAASLALAFHRVGDLHGTAWDARPEDSEQSLPAYQEALGLWRVAHAEDPDDPEVRRGLLSTLAAACQTMRKLGLQEAARPLSDEGLAIARGAYDAAPEDTDALGDLVTALWARGDLHIALEPYEQGLLDTREALTHIEEAYTTHVSTDRLRFFEQWTLLRLAIWVERLKGDVQGAREMNARTVELGLARCDEYDGDPELLAAVVNELAWMFLWNDEVAAPALDAAGRAALLDRLARFAAAVELGLDLGGPVRAWSSILHHALFGYELAEGDRRETFERLLARLADALDDEQRGQALADLDAFVEQWEVLGEVGLERLEAWRSGRPSGDR